MADGQLLQNNGCTSVYDILFGGGISAPTPQAISVCLNKKENDNCSISVPGCPGSGPTTYQGTCGTDKQGFVWCMPNGPICQTNVFRPSMGTLTDPRDNYPILDS